jgi:hypothetical protein
MRQILIENAQRRKESRRLETVSANPTGLDTLAPASNMNCCRLTTRSPLATDDAEGQAREAVVFCRLGRGDSPRTDLACAEAWMAMEILQLEVDPVTHRRDWRNRRRLESRRRRETIFPRNGSPAGPISRWWL